MLINKDSFRSQQEVNDEGGVILQSISTTNLCKRRGLIDKKGRGVSGLFDSSAKFSFISVSGFIPKRMAQTELEKRLYKKSKTIKWRHAKGEKRLTRCDDTAFQPYQNCVAQTRTVAHTKISDLIDFNAMLLPQLFDPRLEKQDPRFLLCHACHDSSVFIFLGTNVSLLPVYHVRAGRVSPGGYFTLTMRRIFATELIFEIIFLETALLRVIDFRRFSGRD